MQTSEQDTTTNEIAERGADLGDPIHDPLHKTTMRFQDRGDDLYVECVLHAGAILPKHRHPVQEEIWWVIEGDVEIFHDGQWRPTRPESGQILVKAGQEHGLRNRGTEDVRLGCDVMPAMDLEAFLTEASWAAREGLIRRGGIPANLKGLGWAARFMRRHSDQTQMSFPPPFAVKLLRPFERIGV
jgi:quercetin dioxygenase-like cupin family protein